MRLYKCKHVHLWLGIGSNIRPAGESKAVNFQLRHMFLRILINECKIIRKSLWIYFLEKDAAMIFMEKIILLVQIDQKSGKSWKSKCSNHQKCSSWKYREICGGWVGIKLFGRESRLINHLMLLLPSSDPTRIGSSVSKSSLIQSK